MQNYINIYLIAINILAFFLYGIDKYKATHRKWRISETALILVAVIGGSIGAYLGMLLFHHKTKKPKFSVGVPVIILLQLIGILAWHNFH